MTLASSTRVLLFLTYKLGKYTSVSTSTIALNLAYFLIILFIILNLLINSLHLSLDNPDRLIDMYVFENLVGLKSIEERIDEIRSVGLEEIIAVGDL